MSAEKMKRLIQWIAAIVVAILFIVPSAAMAEAIESVEDEAALEAVEDEEALEAVEDVEPLEAPCQWSRVYGATARKTMQAIVRTGDVFQPCDGQVFVATEASYKDALTIAGLAGMGGSPILITNPKHLSPETREEIQRLKPHVVVIVGGTKAVSKAVRTEIGSLVPFTKRISGANAVDTAVQIYHSASAAAWGRYAIVATSNGFKDALSIAPFAYCFACPVFLTGSDRVLTADVLGCIASGGFERVLIVGGTQAVSAKVSKQLNSVGVKHKRLAGANAIETSAVVARYAISKGMGIEHMAVATTASYKDALCAVPLCGMLNSVLVLANPVGGLDAFWEIYDPYYVVGGYVIGGPRAISDANYNSIAWGWM